MYKRYEKQEHQENRVIVLLFYRTTIFVCFLFLFCLFFLFFLALTDATRGGKNDRRPKSYSRRKGEI